MNSKDWGVVGTWAAMTDREAIKHEHYGLFRMFAECILSLRESLGALSCVAEEDEHEEKHRRREREMDHLRDRVDIQNNRIAAMFGRLHGVREARRSTHAEMLSRIAKLGKRLDGLESQLIGHFHLHAKQDPPVVIPSVWSIDPPLDEIGSQVTESTRPEGLLQKAADMQPEDSAGPAPVLFTEQPDWEEQIHISVDMKLLDGEPDHDQNVRVQDPWGRRLWIPANWVARGEKP